MTTILSNSIKQVFQKLQNKRIPYFNMYVKPWRFSMVKPIMNVLVWSLTHSWRRPLSYRNKFTDLYMIGTSVTKELILWEQKVKRTSNLPLKVDTFQANVAIILKLTLLTGHENFQSLQPGLRPFPANENPLNMMKNTSHFSHFVLKTLSFLRYLVSCSDFFDHWENSLIRKLD